MPILKEASLRHATFYLERIHALDMEHAKEKSRVFDVLSKLDDEWGNFRVGYGWAKSNLLQDSKAAYLCSMYPCLTFNLLPFRQNPKESLNWNETGLQAVQM